MNIRFLLSLVVFALVGCASPSVVPSSTPTMEVRHIVVTSGVANQLSSEAKVVPTSNWLVDAGNFFIMSQEVTIQQYNQCVEIGKCPPSEMNAEVFCEWMNWHVATTEERQIAAEKGLLVATLESDSAHFRCAVNKN